MKTIFLKTTLLLFAIILNNCENKAPEDQLPPITQTGENTFGAIVDGRVFIPSNSFSSIPGTPNFRGLQVLVGENFEDNTGDDKWTILAGNFKTSPSIFVYVYLPSLVNTNNNLFTINTSDGLKTTDLNHPHMYTYFDNIDNIYLSYENSGQLEFLNLDVINGIYSGIFSVKLKNKNNPNDIIEITNGRFDVNLNTVNK